MKTNPNSPMKNIIGILLIVCVLGLNFYWRQTQGHYFPIVVIAACAGFGIAVLGIVKPQFQGLPTTDEHKKANNAAGLAGAAVGVLLCLLLG